MTQLTSKIRAILPSNFARNVAMLASGTVMGQIIVLLASPLLTRLYTPEDFGYLALYSSILSTIVVIASLRYHLAIPLPKTDQDAFTLLIISCVVLAFTTILAFFIFFLWGDWLFRVLNADPLSRYWWTLPSGLFGAGLYQALSYWSIRQQVYQNLSLTKLTQGISLVLVQIGLGFLKLGEIGLILGDIAGRTAGSGTLARLSLRSDLWSRLSWKHVWQNFKRYQKFPMLSTPSALFNSAGLQLPSLLLLAYYGPQVAGWFALSQRILGIPTTLLGTSISQVYNGQAAQIARQNPKLLNPLFKKMVIRLFLIGLFPAIFLGIAIPKLSIIIFSQNWYQSGLYVQILIPMFLTQFAISPLSQTLIILERQDLQFLWDVVRFIMVIGCLWLGKSVHLTDLQIILAFSFVNLMAYLGLLGLNFYALNRYKNV